MLDDLQELFDAAATTPYNMRSAESKSVCERLTAICWRFLAPYGDGKPSWFDSPEYLSYFRAEEQEYAARIYELMWFANLAYIAKDKPMLLDSAARRLEAEARTKVVPTRSNLILRGCVEYRRKNYQMAKHFISRAHHELIPDSVISPFFAYSRSNCLFDEPYRGAAAPTVSAPGGMPWLLVAADAKYVVKYLPNYVDTMIKAGAHEQLGLHVRVIGTDDTDDLKGSVDAVLHEVIDILGDRVEVSETRAPDVRDVRSWFAAERFIHAKSLLPAKGHLIITDLDYGLQKDPAEFVAWSRNFEVCALLARSQEFKSFFPWLKVQAGTVVVSNTAVGHHFLDNFGRYFESSFVGAGWNWGIDQNALANAHDNIEGRAVIGNINDVAQPFYIPRELKRSSS